MWRLFVSLLLLGMAGWLPCVAPARANTPCLIDTVSFLDDNPSLGNSITYYYWTEWKPAWGFTTDECEMEEDNLFKQICTVSDDSIGPYANFGPYDVFQSECGNQSGTFFVADLTVDCVDVKVDPWVKELTMMWNGHPTCMAAACVPSDAVDYFAGSLLNYDWMNGTCITSVNITLAVGTDGTILTPKSDGMTDAPTKSPGPNNSGGCSVQIRSCFSLVAMAALAFTVLL